MFCVDGALIGLWRTLTRLMSNSGRALAYKMIRLETACIREPKALTWSNNLVGECPLSHTSLASQWMSYGSYDNDYFESPQLITTLLLVIGAHVSTGIV